jgi:hypothetical protein
MKHLNNPYCDAQGSAVCVEPEITGVVSAGLTVGNTGAYIAVTYSGSGPFGFTKASGTLPSGMTLNPITGKVSGTPTTAGEYTYVLKATNACGEDTLSITKTIA